MKYRSVILLVILLALTIPISTQEDIKVEFEDPCLEKAIREAIKKPSGDIYASELKGLKELDAQWHQIFSLRGIEYCTSLNWLRLSYNLIQDISLLAELNSINAIFLTNNQINNIRALSGYRSLTVIGLGNNQISDLGPIANCLTLIALHLSNNKISDLVPLANLKSLEILYLERNQISNISPLTSLVSLRRLDLEDNQISDISPLLKLTSLKWIDLRGNPLNDESVNNIIPLLKKMVLMYYIEIYTLNLKNHTSLLHQPQYLPSYPFL